MREVESYNLFERRPWNRLHTCMHALQKHHIWFKGLVDLRVYLYDTFQISCHPADIYVVVLGMGNKIK